MLFMIDNYDLFIYNLVQYFGEFGEDVCIYCNDEIMFDDIVCLNFDVICLLFGLSNLQYVGIMFDVLCEFVGKKLIFGVCFGYQVIGEVFGGCVVCVKIIMYGKVSWIEIDCCGVFVDLLKYFDVMCYYLFVIECELLFDCFEVFVWIDDGEIMGVCYKMLLVEGVQFYLELILFEYGYVLFENFLKQMCGVVCVVVFIV